MTTRFRGSAYKNMSSLQHSIDIVVKESHPLAGEKKFLIVKQNLLHLEFAVSDKNTSMTD